MSSKKAESPRESILTVHRTSNTAGVKLLNKQVVKQTWLDTVNTGEQLDVLKRKGALPSTCEALGSILSRANKLLRNNGDNNNLTIKSIVFNYSLFFTEILYPEKLQKLSSGGTNI